MLLEIALLIDFFPALPCFTHTQKSFSWSIFLIHHWNMSPHLSICFWGTHKKDQISHTRTHMNTDTRTQALSQSIKYLGIMQMHRYSYHTELPGCTSMAGVTVDKNLNFMHREYCGYIQDDNEISALAEQVKDYSISSITK